MSLLTEKALAASLKKLLEKKTLDKITVKDITDDCGVNRQTFYYHFHDIYDLIEWIFTEEAKRYADGVDVDNWQEHIRNMMDKLLEDKKFILNTFYSINRRQLEQFLQKLARPRMEELVNNLAEGMHVSDEDLDFVVQIYTFGLVGILTEWLASGMSDDFSHMLDKFFLIVDGSIEHTLAKLSL